MTTFIDEIGICRPGLRDSPMLLPTISFNWACPQNIFFLSSSDGNGSFRTFTIHVPQLNYGVQALFGFLSVRDLVLVKKTLWVVTRPHLMHQNANKHKTQSFLIPTTWKSCPLHNNNGKRSRRTDLNFVVFEKRMIKSWLTSDVNTVYNIPIRTLYAIQNKITPFAKILNTYYFYY